MKQRIKVRLVQAGSFWIWQRLDGLGRHPILFTTQEQARAWLQTPAGQLYEEIQQEYDLLSAYELVQYSQNGIKPQSAAHKAGELIYSYGILRALEEAQHHITHAGQERDRIFWQDVETYLLFCTDDY